MDLSGLAVKVAALKAIGAGMWQLLAFWATQTGALHNATGEAVICMMTGLR